MLRDAISHADELVGQHTDPLRTDLQLDRELDRHARMARATTSISRSLSTVRTRRDNSTAATAAASIGAPAYSRIGASMPF
jgi:hypothetical protein